MELLLVEGRPHLGKIPASQIFHFLKACQAACNLSLPETAAVGPSL